MQQTTSLNKQITWLRICITIFLLTLASFFLFSFTVKTVAADFLKQLGITKTTADEKISSSMLGGSFDTYGVKNVKAIPAAARAAVAKEALAYTKQYVSTAAFIKKYNEMRESYKPKFNPLKTPDEMQKENIELYKKSVADAENNFKKADASMKQIFEQVLTEVKKQQKEAENPNSKQYVNYRKNYPEAEKNNKAGYERLLAEWEQQYPSNHLLYIKQRLEQFMQETESIDFAATTTLKNGKQIFTNA